MADDPSNTQETYEAVRRAIQDANKSQQDLIGNLEVQVELLNELNENESSLLVKLERKKAIEESMIELNKLRIKQLKERLSDMDEITTLELAQLKALQDLMCLDTLL